jgi:hypothetical protein
VLVLLSRGTRWLQKGTRRAIELTPVLLSHSRRPEDRVTRVARKDVPECGVHFSNPRLYGGGGNLPKELRSDYTHQSLGVEISQLRDRKASYS